MFPVYITLKIRSSFAQWLAATLHLEGSRMMRQNWLDFGPRKGFAV
jgi:hypothetical protein